MDADGSRFEHFQKKGLTQTECSDFCTQEPKCDGFYHFFFASGFCAVLGPGLALPADWNKVQGNGGVWPIAKGKVTGVAATCYQKTAATTGNVRQRSSLP